MIDIVVFGDVFDIFLWVYDEDYIFVNFNDDNFSGIINF